MSAILQFCSLLFLWTQENCLNSLFLTFLFHRCQTITMKDWERRVLKIYPSQEIFAQICYKTQHNL